MYIHTCCHIYKYTHSLKGCEGTLEMEAVTDVTDGWAQQQQCAFAADCPVCHSTRPPPLPVCALK